MTSVGSAFKADAIDQHTLIGAVSTNARPRPDATASASDAESASISNEGKLKSRMQDVVDSIQALAHAQLWQAQRVQSSQPEQVSATSDGASAGVHGVAVDQAASGQVTATVDFSSLSTVVAIGTLSLQMGKWNSSSSTFATNPNWPKANITLGAQDNSLDKIRDRINAASLGVYAVVVSDSIGSRLVLSSSSTGSDNGFRIQANPEESADLPSGINQLSQLAYDPAQGGPGMQLTQSAQDASVQLDGQTLISSSNTLDAPQAGLQLQVNQATRGAATLAVQPDDAQLSKQLQTFASDVNALRSALSDQGENSGGAQQDAQALMTRVQDAVTGSASADWQSLGVSWDEHNGLTVSTPPNGYPDAASGTKLFEQLARDLPSSSATSDASAAANALSSPVQAAAVRFNLQRLQDSYAGAATASNQTTSQELELS